MADSKVLPQVGKLWVCLRKTRADGSWVSWGAGSAGAEITVCTVCARAGENARCTLDGADYVVLPRRGGGLCPPAGEKIKPDLVHLWGSEYPPAMAPANRGGGGRRPVLLSAQGLMGPCAEHLLDGVPARYCGSCFGSAALTGGARRTAGQNWPIFSSRPGWIGPCWPPRQLCDRPHPVGLGALAVLAPKAAYYPCGETLRPAFYGPEWDPKAQNRRPRCCS